MRERDYVSALLSTVTLDAIVQKIAGVGTINKSLIQVKVYSNDVVLIRKSKKELEIAAMTLEEEAKVRGSRM